MNNTERRIIHMCMTSLSSLPGKGNAMSGKGAAQYHNEIKEALSYNTAAMRNLLDGDYDTALKFANTLVNIVWAILIINELALTPTMLQLQKEVNDDDILARHMKMASSTPIKDGDSNGKSMLDTLLEWRRERESIYGISETKEG